MNQELKDFKTDKNDKIKKRIAEKFIRRKEKQEGEELKQIHKKLFWYGGLILSLVISGFLIGWFSSLVHHTDSDVIDIYAKPESIDTGVHCEEGEISGGQTCLYVRKCNHGHFEETKCPKHHQYDFKTKSCTWIHLATCEEGVEKPTGASDMGESAEDTPAITADDAITGDDAIPDLQRALDTEVRLLMKHGLQRIRRSVSTLPNKIVEKISAGRQENPENVLIVESLISPRKWKMLFPIRNQIYTYNSFLKAVGKFPHFCRNENVCKSSLAVIFAHFTQETGAHDRSLGYPEWRQGLYYLEEAGCSNINCGYSSNCPQKSWLTEKWPCGKKDDGGYYSYHGRGAKQISYNYNYGQFSSFMFGNATMLLNKPDMISESWLALASAIWFFLMPQPPKPSMLQVLDGSWRPNQKDLDAGLKKGFGVTTNIINGGVECGKGSELQQSINRQEYFRHFYSELGVDDPSLLENAGCATVKEFGEGGSGSQAIYWEQDWARRYYCKLVSYATPYSALVPGDYLGCVETKFDVKIL